ncbi:MAG: ABC transporter substrate-binding protein [Nanoarchaeota archaeon]|nr:ABC transporter substrate-binding protein [Nanoarchaeota archaeon]
MNKTYLIIAAAILAIALTGGYIYYTSGEAPAQIDGAQNPGDTNGITDSEILIGSSSALSGHASFLGTQYTRGSLAFINDINEKGGVQGRKIRMITYDDEYDPPKTVANTQKLIADDKVFMLFDYVGTPTSVRIIDMVDEAKIPLLGLFTGAEELRTPFRKYIFNVRASYYDETEAAVAYFADNLGLKKIAVFYQDDAFGMTGLKGTEIALSKRSMSLAAKASYARGTENVEAGVETIMNSNPDAVIMIGTYAPIAKFVALYKKEGQDPYFHSVSFVGSDAFAEELSKRGINSSDKIIVTQVVSDPYEVSAIHLKIVKDYRDLTAKYFPGNSPTYTGLEGFVNAKLLVRALDAAGRDLSREKLIQTLESFEDYSVGIGIPVNYGPADHQAFDRIFFSRLAGGRFLLFEGGGGRVGGST